MADIKVNLIGAGRVGQTFLGLVGAADGYAVQDVMSRRYVSASAAVEQAGCGLAVRSYADMRPADLWIIAVPDGEIKAVATALAQVIQGRHPPCVAFHCSGYFASDQLAALADLGWKTASVHPVRSFADPAQAIARFGGTLCGVEGAPGALAQITPMLDLIGGVSFEIGSQDKSLYHAAAVISNNFTVVLQAVARDAWTAAGVPEDIAKALNETLLQGTCDNVAALGPRGALTGPAARGDDAVVASQGADVAAWNPAVGDIYRDLSALAKALKASD